MKLILQNPHPLYIISSAGNLPSEEQGREKVKQEYNTLIEIQNSFKIEFNRTNEEFSIL